MTTLEGFKKRVLPYKDTLVIDEVSNNVCRLVDVSEDEEDFYWVFEGDDIYKSSCIGTWIPLKGYIPNEDYEGMVYTWNLNNDKKAN